IWGFPAARDDFGPNEYWDPRPVSAVPFWGYYTNNSINLAPSQVQEWSGVRMYINSRVNAHGSGWVGNYTYNAPNNSTIFAAHFVQMVHAPAQYTTLLAGIVNSGGAWEGGNTFGNVGGMPQQDWVVCVLPSCGMAGSANNNARFEMHLDVPGGGATTVAPSTSFRGAYIYYSDYNAPGLWLTGVPSSSWQKVPQLSVNAHVDDWGGVGFSNVLFDDWLGWGLGTIAHSAVQVRRNGALRAELGPHCSGGVLSPCPTVGDFAFSEAPPEGIHSYEFRAGDFVGQVTPQTHQLRVDNSGPTVALSGRFGAFALDASAQTGPSRTMVKDTPFVITATDGATTSNAARRSGAKDISAQFYASQSGTEQIDVNSPVGAGFQVSSSGTISDCDPAESGSQDSCSLKLGDTFNASSLAPGTYFLRVTAHDFAANETVKDFKVAVGIAEIASVTEGQSTAQYLPLQIVQTKLPDGSSIPLSHTSTARLHWRKNRNDNWSEVPTSAVQLESSGAELSDWPISLTNGVSQRWVIDISKLGSTPPDDGDIAFRALVDGGQPEHQRRSEDVTIRYDRGGKDTDDDRDQIGPGSVDLVTGNFSMSATDATVSAPKSPLTVTRTYNSRYSDQSSVFGPGWSLGQPAESTGAPYTGLTDYADVGLSEWERFAYVEVKTGANSGIGFELNEATGEYTSELGLGSLKLERKFDPNVPTQTLRFELADLDDGTVTVFERPNSSAPVGEFVPTKIQQTGSSEATKLAYSFSGGKSYLESVIASSDDVSCGSDWSSIPRGCQAISFGYIDTANGKRLQSATQRLYDPELSPTPAMRNEEIARYSYDAQGRLTSAWDPRITPNLATSYSYGSGTESGLITQVTPAGEDPFTLTYFSLANDAKPGRLDTVSRDVSGNPSTWHVRYQIPTSGSGAPFNMSDSVVADWGQDNPPFLASAVFSPDQPPNGRPASNYEVASMSYLDPVGREVNARSPGGRLDVTEYDKYGDVTRELTAENRARAMLQPNPLAASEKWDTQKVYEDVSGSFDARRHLIETRGPEREVRLDDGSLVQARTRTQITYDENSPIAGDNTKEPFDLPTTEHVSALVGTENRDTRTTKTSYGTTEAEWKLRVPRETVTDPGSGNLNIKRKVDVNEDGLETARYQPRSQNSSEPSTTKTIYWSATSNPEDAECANRPEWVGLPCKVLPGAQPTTAGLPELPIKKVTYNYLRQPLTTTETVVDASGSTKTRTNTATYDEAGRVVTESVSGSVGEPVKTTKHIYSPATGREVETQSLNTNGTVHKAITRTFDAIGRQTNYTDSEGHSSYVVYDQLSRIQQTGDGKATRTHSYDAITGDLTSIDDSGTGVFSASYDQDGRVISTSMPGGMVKTFNYTASGFQDYVSYSNANGVVFQNWAKESAHGQIRELWQDILPQGQSLKETAYEYRYDKAGRLKEVGD
ncbi:MAG: DUF6531 domain-containing protein, partial [Solirubrobacterales bacterium]